MSTDVGENSEQLDRGGQLFLVQLVFLLAAGICTLVRAYVKLFMVKHVTIDDYLIFSAMAAYTAYGAIALDGVVNGATGKHRSHITSPDEAARSLRAWYICEVLYPPIAMAVRCSLCVLLFRLASKTIHRWIIWINLGLVTIISVAFFFILAFQCYPVSYFWRQVYGNEGHCINKEIVPYSVFVHSIVSALSDWCLGLLPIALLWHVKINRRTKAIIAILLSLGMIAGVALIVRIPYVTYLKPSIDFLYVSINIAIWTVMEPALGIIAACIATFRPLFKHRGFGWSSENEGYVVNPSQSHRATGQWHPPTEGQPNATLRIMSLAATSGRNRNPDEESIGSEYELCRTVQVKVASENNSTCNNESWKGIHRNL
ncbi:integral membrane protein [Dactylonectria estremocensis]|uniref:Integral membrane protein n=1 Tax=Dactylonectria estremocensis TaxID=1079267 RepID=A0A9P9DRW8_9HYPO|nr:integral membrane protein [Dactylonectria estremocensis]